MDAPVAQPEDGAAATEPQLIAWHFAQAGAPSRSIDYYLEAAERATGRFALGEMVSHLRDALGQLEQLPDSPERRRRELSLQIGLGRALIDYRGGGSEQVRAAFERARELCLELDDTQRLIQVHDGLVNHHGTHSELKKVLLYSGELLNVGRKTGDPQAFLIAYRSGAFANLLIGRFDEARRDSQLLIDMYDVERDGPQASLTIRDPKASAGTGLGICLTAMGFPVAGATASLEGVKHAESLNHPISLTLSLRRACVQRMMQRDAQGVVALSSRLLGMASEYETFKGPIDGTIFHCWAQLQTDGKAALLDQMQSCIEQLDTTGNWVMLPFFIACAAQIRGDRGDPDGALTLLDRAAELGGITGEKWCEAEIKRLQACFVRNPDETGILLQASLAIAKDQGAKLWELRTATTLANVWRGQGKLAAAREILAPVYAWFTEGFDAPDLVTARALLDNIDRSASRC